MSGDREQRVIQLGELRVFGEDGESPKIVGHAAIFNSWSEDLGGFRELVSPGFFKNVLNNDVRALWNHNSDMVMGRTRNGTLRIAEDETGLRIEIDPPDTAWARDAQVSIARRDVDQMSFAFRVKDGGDRFDFDREHGHMRILLPGGCERLYDVSPVAFPAYSETSASVRSAFEAFKATNWRENEDGPEGGAGEGDGTTEAGELQARRRRMWARLELAERR